VREYIPHLVEAIKSVLGGRVKAYITGPAMEGRLTVDSDIDVDRDGGAPRSGLERAKMVDRIWRIMEDRGAPWWHPFEILLMTEDELKILEEPKLLRIQNTMNKERGSSLCSMSTLITWSCFGILPHLLFYH